MNASKHFKWSELQCPCCGIHNIQPEAIRKLELLRVAMGVPLVINSAARCPKHNREVGGGENSQHLSIEETKENDGRESTAFDISLRGGKIDKAELIDKAIAAGFEGMGVNYNTFVHVDNRGRYARW